MTVLNNEENIQASPTYNVGREAWQRSMPVVWGIGGLGVQNNIGPYRDIRDEPVGSMYMSLRTIATMEPTDEATSLLGIFREAEEPYLKREGELNYFEKMALAERVIGNPFVDQVLASRDVKSSNNSLVESWRTFAEIFTEGIGRAVGLGVAQPEVKKRATEALAKTPVWFADAALLGHLATALYSTFEADIGSDAIIVGHDLPSSRLVEVLTHEFIHKISGGTFREIGRGFPPQRERTGFSSFSLAVPDGSKINLDEAIVQFLTVGIITNDFATLDPDSRDFKGLQYEGNIKVFANFIKKSRGFVNPNSFTKTLFEDTEPGSATINYRRALIREVSATFGIGALRKLDILMGVALDLHPKNSDLLEEHILSRIHEPVVDEDGNITKKGWINIENLSTAKEILAKNEAISS